MLRLSYYVIIYYVDKTVERMGSKSDDIRNFMKNPNQSQSLLFDPETGTLSIEEKGRRQTSGTDQKVMLSMNQKGAGGFFADKAGVGREKRDTDMLPE